MVFKRILVINSDEFKKRKRLFEELSNTYKIRFSTEYKEYEADGIISFNDSVAKRYSKPALFYFQEQESYIVKKKITFRNAKLDGIDYSNRTLYTDSIIITNSLGHFKNDEIIAEQDNMVIWAKKEYEGVKHYYSVIAPKELLDYESMKHLFFSNDIISTLPLLAFLREVIKPAAVQPGYISDDMRKNDPVLQEVYETDILFSRTASNPEQAGISSITMDIISGQRLSPARYFEIS